MTITTISTVDEITVTQNGIILVRTATRVLDGEKEVAVSYDRTSLVPGQDISTQPANVQAIANLTWTSEVITTYQKSLPTTPTLGA